MHSRAKSLRKRLHEQKNHGVAQRCQRTLMRKFDDYRCTGIRNGQQLRPCNTTAMGVEMRTAGAEKRADARWKSPDVNTFVTTICRKRRPSFPCCFSKPALSPCKTCPLTRQKLPFGYPKGQVLKRSCAPMGCIVTNGCNRARGFVRAFRGLSAMSPPTSDAPHRQDGSARDRHRSAPGGPTAHQ